MFNLNEEELKILLCSIGTGTWLFADMYILKMFERKPKPKEEIDDELLGNDSE